MTATKTEQGYEVEFAGTDDGLCAQRPGASYFVSSEDEAKRDVAGLQARGFEASYREAVWF